MAPRNKPMPSGGLKKIPTFDTDSEKLFRLWQEAGRIPPQYNSWEELKVDFMSRIADGKSAPQVRKEMGVEYKNIIGNPILNIEKNKDTGAVEFAEGGMRRAIREDFNIAEENEIRRLYGQGEVDKFRTELRNDWNQLSEGERVAVQKNFHKQFHRGHVAGAKKGGSIARENMWPEHGLRNSLHGALPRWPVEVMEQLGVPQNWISAYYEKLLASEGMPAAPRINDELATAADERGVTPISDRPSNIKGQTQWNSDIPTDARGKKWQPDLTGEAGIDPNTLEMRGWKQKDAIAQVGEDAVRAHQADLSATMSRGNAVAQSGLSRVVQEGGPTVTTKGVPKGLMPPKVARNPLMRGAKAISRAIPGPADALIPGVIGGGLALAGGATLPQAAEAFGSGVAEGLTGDIDAGPLANNQAYVVNGQQRFINQRNELVDQPGYGLQQRNGNWEVVKRGTGVAAQQERQANQQMVQQASNLIPKVNRAMNPVGAKITNEAQYFIINPLQRAFKNVFGSREI